MLPFRSTEQYTASTWNASSARNGFASQQSREGSNSWDASQSWNSSQPLSYQPSGLLGSAPSFGSFLQTTNAAPNFSSLQKSAGPRAPFGGWGGTQRGAIQPRGGGQPSRGGTQGGAMQPRGGGQPSRGGAQGGAMQTRGGGQPSWRGTQGGAIQPRGGGQLTRGGIQGGAIQPRGGGQPGVAGQTRGRGTMTKPGAGAVTRSPQIRAAAPKPAAAAVTQNLQKAAATPKVPAPVVEVEEDDPVKMEELLTTLKEVECKLEIFRGMYGQVLRAQIDVANVKLEVEKLGIPDVPEPEAQSKPEAQSMPAEPAASPTGKQAVKRPAVNAAEPTPKVQKLDRPFRSCVYNYNNTEALLAPTSPTSGLVIIAGHPSLPVTPDDYYVFTKGIHSFSKLMTAQKVQCEVARITFEDGTTENVVLRIHPIHPTAKEFLARTMKKAGIEGRIVIKSPELALVKCFRKKDNDWFELTPNKFFMNKEPLTTFEGFDPRTRCRFFPDYETLEKEGKFVCKAAWDKGNFPFERPIDEGCLVELIKTENSWITNCQVLTGMYKGCLARLDPETASNFSQYDIMKCGVQITEDSDLRVLNPVLVPTKKVANDPKLKAHVSPLDAEPTLL